MKIKSGVYGLNDLMNGGIIRNSTTVVIGPSGAGKTTFATQFLRRGIELGEEGIYITLDEEPHRLIQEAIEMGWDDAKDALDKGSFVFVDATGKQFTDFIRSELHNFVQEWKGHKARLVIDPLTPVLWSTENKYEQRELITYLLRETRKVGTVLCTLEEHGMSGDLSGPETVIPMYLADNVIHLRYTTAESPERRELKIIKSRRSKHSKFGHPYIILKGAGLIIMQSDTVRKRAKRVPKFDEMFMDKIKGVPAKTMDGLTKAEMDNIKRTVNYLLEDDFGDLKPSELISLILKEYSLPEGELGGEDDEG